MFLTAFYVGIIQVVLFLMTFIILFCELTKVFEDTFKSVLLRSVLAFSLIIMGFYAHHLEKLPYAFVLSLFIVVLMTCFFVSKHIFKEYSKRKRKEERLQKIREIRSSKK